MKRWAMVGAMMAVIALIVVFMLFSSKSEVQEINESVNESQTFIIEDPMLTGEICFFNESFSCQEACDDSVQRKIFPETQEGFLDCALDCCLTVESLASQVSVEDEPLEEIEFNITGICGEDNTTICSLTEDCQGTVVSMEGAAICCLGECVEKSPNEIQDMIKRTSIWN